MPRILGLDYGTKRLGFAVSDPSGTLALPLRVEVCENEAHALNITERICGQTKAERLVVGLPLNMDGSRGPQAIRVESFVDRLRSRLKIPIELWDERLSSRAVERAMSEGGAASRQQRGRLDKLAAQWMLQGYLDAHEAQRNESEENRI